jgi:dihydrofolate reductase
LYSNLDAIILFNLWDMPTASEGAQTPVMTSRPSLTLIVAATSNLGIGVRGALPWRLKSEMQYFARVTTRVPPEYLETGSTAQPDQTKKVQNAVLMGRKTWESIPAKFRPLKGRLNVVLSSKAEEGSIHDGALWASSLESALRVLADLTSISDHPARHTAAESAEPTEGVSAAIRSDSQLPRIARAFVIGGAAVYKAAMELPQTTSVLLTRVHGDWECDTFFPVDLDKAGGWQQADLDRLRDWTGEQLQQSTIKEGDTEFEYTLYEKIGASRS